MKSTNYGVEVFLTGRRVLDIITGRQGETTACQVGGDEYGYEFDMEVEWDNGERSHRRISDLLPAAPKGES